MASPRNGRYVWVTWLAKLMAGETQCEWSVWFRANYRDWDRVESDLDLTSWQIAHTRMIREQRAILKTNGLSVRQENQNSFTFLRPSGLVLSGRPDLLAVASDKGSVQDVKSGAPRVADRIQVMIYMYCLPRVFTWLEGVSLSGRVVYQDHVSNIEPELINQTFEDQFNYFLEILESDPPDRTASEQECKFCNIGRADCPDRFSTL